MSYNQLKSEIKEWKVGEIQWFSNEFEEGMIIDTQDNESYYLNRSAAKKLKKLTKTGRIIKKVKFKTNISKRAKRASDIKLDY